MSLHQFHLFLWVMSSVALLVFIALYFVKAGYGMFRTASWGWSISNKVAWVLMEAPVFFVMLGLWMISGVGFSAPQFLFLLLFELHYLQRSFVFPLLMKGRSRMPVAIMAMGIVFNVLNGLMQAGGIFWYAPEGYAEGWAWLMRPLSSIGLGLFFVGMGIKGMYRYVTSANYFGELVEWTGFALLTASPAAWVFVWWTAANLVPRADAIHKHYREEFGNEAVGRRKRIIPYIY